MFYQHDGPHAADRKVFASMLRSTTVSAGLVRRARVILALADCLSYESIATAHDGEIQYRQLVTSAPAGAVRSIRSTAHGITICG